MPEAAAPRSDVTIPGTDTFVGAGPGDADHLTLRAARALAEAEVIIHDRLVGPSVLALANPAALLIDAGKEGFGPSTAQSDINALNVVHAAAGSRVVRLKGGDVGIFGRLDEEIEALEARGLGMARKGEVAAIYMGKKSARFVQGRLMMHGADPATDVTIVENVSRPDQRILGTTLADLPDTIAGVEGPAVILYGLAPRRATAALPQLKEAFA